jgi:branched-chain amino acid transport system substrate-binding protein
VTLVATGCSSSSKGASSTTSTAASTGATAGSSAHQTTYTIGLLGDFTGAASATSKYMPEAVQAAIDVAATEGYKIKMVQADTQSTPAGALAGAQKLVSQDHVYAVIAISDLTFGAAQYLASNNVPVVGADVDGPEWITDRNMFSIFGAPDYTKVTAGTGLFFKTVGATNVGVVGYQIIPSSADVAKATPISDQAAGIKTGYVNAQFPLGSTNVGPIVIALKNAGVDAVSALIQQNSGFAIINGLRQEGVTVKAPVLWAGYGSDLLDAGPATLSQAQNVYFAISYEPVEMHTPATEKFQDALKKYANFTESPGLNEYLGYVAVDAFVDGLKAAGANPTQAQFINAMLGITNYDGAGLFGSHTLSFAMSARGGTSGADGCIWYTLFQGSTFHLVPNADPVCGGVIPGKVS